MTDRTTDDVEWQRYARAVIGAMQEVLEEVDDRHRELLLEASDYWLAVGLSIGVNRPDEAERLLTAIESDSQEREELLADATDLISAALP